MLTSSVVPAHRAQTLHADSLLLVWAGESHALLMLLYLLKLELLWSVVLLLLLLLLHISEGVQRKSGKGTVGRDLLEVLRKVIVYSQLPGPRSIHESSTFGLGTVWLIPHLLLVLFLDLDARQSQVCRCLEEAWGLKVVIGGSKGCLAGDTSLQKFIVCKFYAELDDLRREEVAAALRTDVQ